jgi:hypothetical protein
VVVGVDLPCWGRIGFTMKRRRHTSEKVVRTLREADKLLTEGQHIEELMEPFLPARNLLKSIPGFSQTLAEVFIAGPEAT